MLYAGGACAFARWFATFATVRSKRVLLALQLSLQHIEIADGFVLVDGRASLRVTF